MPSSRGAPVKHAEEYFKLGLKEYEAKKYDAAISAFDRAITLGDRSLVTWDLKVASMSKADGPNQERAYSAVKGLLVRFAKDLKVWKVHYRKADILRRMGLYNKAILALDVAKTLLSRLPASSQIDASARIIAFQSSLRIEASKVNERGRKEGEVHQAELDRRIRYKTLVETNHFAKAFSPDVLMCICEHGMETNPNFGVIMRGVCREWRDGLGLFPAVFGQLVLTGKRPAGIPPHRRTTPGEKTEEKEELWKRLSGGKIRSLKISGYHESLDRITHSANDFLDSLQRLEINTWSEGLLAKWAGRLRKLEELKLKCDRNDPRWDHPLLDFSLGFLHRDSTSLRRLELTNLRLLIAQRTIHPPLRDQRDEDNTPDAVPSPLEHLEKFDIESCSLQGDTSSPRDCMFQYLPRVRELSIANTMCITCYITVREGADQAHIRRQPIELSHLGRFTQTGPFRHQVIGQDMLTDSSMFLLDRFILTPSLIDLSLYRIECPILDGLENGGFDLSRLQSLDIGKNVVTDHDRFLSLARQMTSLRFLNISHTSLGDTFLQAIGHRDGLEESDQILPNLVAISLAHTIVSTLAVRDFVNSRLPPHKRMTTSKRIEPVKPKIGGAFRPSKRPKPASTSISPTPVTAVPPVTQATSLLSDLDDSIFSTQISKPSPVRSIRWICLDGCETIAPDLIPLLKKHVKYVSWWLGTPVEERHRGMGRWDWRGDCASCVDTNVGCYMRPVGNNQWTVQHTCQHKHDPYASHEEAENEDEQGEKGKEEAKGWWRHSEKNKDDTQALKTSSGRAQR